MRHTHDPELEAQVQTFAKNMRAARIKAGFTTIGLSRAIPLNRTTIALLERAERAPGLCTLLAVARSLDITPASLLGEAGWPCVQTAAPWQKEEPSQPSLEGTVSFATNLRTARLWAGLSQEALARSARVDRAVISVYERGVRDPNLRTVLKLSRALRLQPTVLLEGLR
ncbi:MAG: helix-turn-helix domain-containing protein [Solirubrobacteraceae bacterium]